MDANNRKAVTIAAFDFDGTLLRGDSMSGFIRFVHGPFRLWLGLFVLSPIIMGFLLRLIPRQPAKEWLLRWFFKGRKEAELCRLGERFATEVLVNRIYPQGLKRIRWHQEQGHQCYLVSASLTIWLRAWADHEGLTLVATEPEIKDGIFTGNIHNKNCHGEEKVRRLQELISDKHIEKIYAYGDTKGDLPLLDWADEGHYQPFAKGNSGIMESGE